MLDLSDTNSYHNKSYYYHAHTRVIQSPYHRKVESEENIQSGYSSY